MFFFIFFSTNCFALSSGAKTDISGTFLRTNSGTGESFSIAGVPRAMSIENFLITKSQNEISPLYISRGSIDTYDNKYGQYINNFFNNSELDKWPWTTPPASPAIIYSHSYGASPESLSIRTINPLAHGSLANVITRTSFDMSRTEPIHLLLLGMALIGVGCTLRRNMTIKGWFSHGRTQTHTDKNQVLLRGAEIAEQGRVWLLAEQRKTQKMNECLGSGCMLFETKASSNF